jgi:hypothetical protein
VIRPGFVVSGGSARETPFLTDLILQGAGEQEQLVIPSGVRV